MIEGTTISMGGIDRVIPALTLRQLKELQPKLESLARINPLSGTTADIEPFIDIVHAALSRNYPDLKRDELEDLIDLRNAPRIAQAIINLSGLATSGEQAAGNR